MAKQLSYKLRDGFLVVPAIALMACSPSASADGSEQSLVTATNAVETEIDALAATSVSVPLAEPDHVTALLDGVPLTFHVVNGPIEDFWFGETGVRINAGDLPADLARDTLEIVATSEPDGSGAILLISQEYRGDPTDARDTALMMVSHVLYYPDGPQPPYWSSNVFSNTGADITVTGFLSDGMTGHAEGDFSAELCAVAEFDQEPDANNCRPMVGQFNVSLKILD